MRAAIRLGRRHGALSTIMKGIAEGSMTIISDVIRECALDPNALPDPLFESGEHAVYRNIAALQAPAVELVYGLAGFNPLDDHEQDEDEEGEEANDDTPSTTFVARMENLFGFATGMLRWTPEEALNATPSEIIAAYRFRERAYAPKEAKPEDAIRAGFANLSDHLYAQGKTDAV
ncbi:hypothetical protein U0C82_01190 [Fulvimarina sp. 2208YS6-2-32]|uniref:Uncharacterized protein n=1 Tax=Fulvimarina uroteuthidis TaxID=3098149 RepID=A0ABU5HX97_9HYPH|nr:hypothetical protein [Fulvimarina sp. 2208YS6-2-32]MDY8107760.1 hypothetical protein [Fulvimarina sp. 2208YS6-2-32]